MNTEQTPKQMMEKITAVFEKCGDKVTSIQESAYSGIIDAEIKPVCGMVLGPIQLSRLAAVGIHVYGIKVVPYGNHQVFAIEFLNHEAYVRKTNANAKSCGDKIYDGFDD